MNAGEISIGTKVEFNLFNDMGEMLGKTYKGEFFEIKNDSDVVIFSVGQGLVPVSFSKKITVSAHFSHHLHGPLSFNGKLTRKEITETGTKFHVTIDKDFTLQKREYYRPDSILNAEYRLAPDNKEIPYKKAITKNISYTGISLVLDEADGISQNSFVDIKVWLNEKISISIRCKVIRVSDFEINRRKRYQLGLLIEEISESDKRLLEKYITGSLIDQSLYWGDTPFHMD